MHSEYDHGGSGAGLEDKGMRQKNGQNNINAGSNDNHINALPATRSAGWILGQWRMEFLAFLVACGLLGAIFGILKTYHGELLNHWTVSGINLNSFVAILSAIFRALIILVVEEVISQHKWLWQLHRNPISHLNSIDKASRGLIGSILLPFRLRTIFSNVYSGCLIMVLSLAIGPFSQQAVGTETCVKEKPDSSVKVPFTLDGPPYFRYGAGLFDVEPGFSGRMASAAVDPLTQNSTFLVDGCQTGNCTFRANEQGYHLSTFGVCSRCMDTTKFLEKRNLTNTTFVSVSLSGLYALTANYETMGLMSLTNRNLSWAESEFDDEMRYILSGSIMNHTIIGSTSSGCRIVNETTTITECTPSSPDGFTWSPQNGGNVFNVYSSACSLYLCMRHHKVTVDRGVLQEEVVATSPGFTLERSTTPVYYAWKPTCKIGDETIDFTNARTVSHKDGNIQVRLGDSNSEIKSFPNSTECLATASWPSWRGLNNALNLFNGTCLYPAQASSNSLKARREQIRCGPYLLSGFMSDGLSSPEAISNIFQAVADSITNRMRQLAAANEFKSYSTASEDPKGGYIYGTELETNACTRFDGKWLLFPLVLLVATAIYLIHMVTRSILLRDQEPVWKSSILPALYVSSGSQLQAGSQSLHELEKKAGQDCVRLVKTGDYQWELVKEMGLSDQEQPPILGSNGQEQGSYLLSDRHTK